MAGKQIEFLYILFDIAIGPHHINLQLLLFAQNVVRPRQWRPDFLPAHGAASNADSECSPLLVEMLD